MNNMELETDIEALDMEMGDVTIHYCPVIPNPEGEPTAELKTADIEGTIYEIVDEEARTELENKVDKVEGKGLSENDYTDEDKAIVDGVTTALDGKVDKDGDKVLSDNNYSDTDKTIVDGVTEALNGKADKSDTYTKSEVDSALESKVNKDGDKVLSDNNYSDTDKSIVDGVTTALLDKVDKEEGKGLSSNDYTDTEKALVGTIEDKLDKTETAVNSNGLVIATPVTDTAPYIYRQTPVKESFKALMHKIVGASVVWNQLVDSNTTSVTIASGHRYIAKINGTLTFGTSDGTAITVSANDYLTDLTAMFGTTIADYVYTLETSQSGSGIAWLQSYGFFTEDYYAYKQNKLESVNTSGRKVVGKNRCVEVVDNALSISGTTRVVVYGTGTTAFIECKKGETYTVSGATGRNRALVGYFDDIPDYQTEVSVFDNSTEANGQIFSTTTTGYSFTAQYTGYAGIYLANSVLANVNIQVEIGTTATDYVPYAEPTTYPISPITLRGLFKLSTDKLTVNGDEYNADGSVTRKRKRLLPSEIIANYSSFNSTTNNYSAYLYDSLNAITNSSGTDKNPSKAISNFDNCESTWNQMQSFDHANKIGVYHHPSWNYTRVYISIADTSVTTKEQAETWIRSNIEAIEYEMATPTTEQTTPFTETEIVGSTEEFIDYEVAHNTRDVAIPVGTETDYYQEMKLPSLPTTSGNHNLIYNIATGFGWS